jgi:hypothetical protein
LTRARRALFQASKPSASKRRRRRDVSNRRGIGLFSFYFKPFLKKQKRPERVDGKVILAEGIQLLKMKA